MRISRCLRNKRKLYLRPQRPRIGAAFRRGFHPDHVAVRALGEELLQPLFGQWRRIRPRDADHVEAAGAGGLDQRRFEAGGLAQKSRSV